MKKSIKRSIEDVKEGKVIKPQSVEQLFKEMEEERRKHPVRVWLRVKFWQIIRFPGDVKRTIRAFLQRGKRGYANCDVWGLCYYLSDVIAKAVYHLKRNNNGHPNDLTEGQWIDILNEIRDTFYTAKDITTGDVIYIPTKEWSERKYKKWCRIIKNINKKYNSNDRVLTRKQAKKFEDGWKLFQEYFFNLWD